MFARSLFLSIGTPDIFTWVIVGYFSTTRKISERDHSCAQLHSFNLVTNNTGQQNFTFFFVPRGKISNPDSTFNTEFKEVRSFSPSPTVFFCDSQVKCAVLERHTLRVPSTMNQRLSHSLPASEHIQVVI
jgi:hypothetical protein